MTFFEGSIQESVRSISPSLLLKVRYCFTELKPFLTNVKKDDFSANFYLEIPFESKLSYFECYIFALSYSSNPIISSFSAEALRCCGPFGMRALTW